MQTRLSQAGFTLVEMLVSLALFTTISTMAVGTLVILIGSNTKIVDKQAIYNSLTYVLDSMTREIRTGSHYFCASAAGVQTATIVASVDRVADCVSTGGAGLSFREAGESLTTGGIASRRIAYYLESGTLYRKIEDRDPQPILIDNVTIDSVRFYALGSEPLTENDTEVRQPTVTIVVKARPQGGDAASAVTIQTTVTQRQLDI